MPAPVDLGAAALGVSLLLLAAIDVRTQRLPDRLTLPLLAAGLALAATEGPGVLADRAAAAALAWGVFTALAAGYRRQRGCDGLGGGDIKLFAAAGAWVGLARLPDVALLAASGALAAIALAALTTGWTVRRRIPFGPFVAAALWLVWR